MPRAMNTPQVRRRAGDDNVKRIGCVPPAVRHGPPTLEGHGPVEDNPKRPGPCKNRGPFKPEDWLSAENPGRAEAGKPCQAANPGYKPRHAPRTITGSSGAKRP
jgi:hypothetical protein